MHSRSISLETLRDPATLERHLECHPLKQPHGNAPVTAMKLAPAFASFAEDEPKKARASRAMSSPRAAAPAPSDILVRLTRASLVAVQDGTP